LTDIGPISKATDFIYIKRYYNGIAWRYRFALPRKPPLFYCRYPAIGFDNVNPLFIGFCRIATTGINVIIDIGVF